MRGVFAICGQAKDCKKTLFNAAFCLQGRGQAYCGLATSNGSEKIQLRTHLGKVFQTFSNDLAGLEGFSGIVSVSDHDRQPRPKEYKYGSFNIAFDGYLRNASELRRDMMTRGHSFETLEDVDLLGSIIAEGVALGTSFEDGIIRVFKMISGPCSMVVLTNEGVVYAGREPMGMQSLVLGKDARGRKWAVSSESTAFNDCTGLQLVRDILPGEIVRIDRNGVETVGQLNNHHRICNFEFCYFARGNSVMEGVSVTDARHNFGRRLYERDLEAGSPALEANYIAPVLFSSWHHAEGYELASGRPLLAAFLPPQFSDRTYNIADVEKRLLVRMLKHRTVKSNLKGMKIVVVDDSIRSSITMSGMIRDLRKAGAKEVHVRIGSPVSVRNCPWAPPPTKKEEYIAATHSVEQIRQVIGADTLAYLEIEDMSECIGIDSDRLCLDCFLTRG